MPTLPLGKSSRRHVVDVVVLFTFLRQTMKRFDGMAESVSSCPVALLSWTFDGASVRLTRFSFGDFAMTAQRREEAWLWVSMSATIRIDHSGRCPQSNDEDDPLSGLHDILARLRCFIGRLRMTGR